MRGLSAPGLTEGFFISYKTGTKLKEELIQGRCEFGRTMK